MDNPKNKENISKEKFRIHMNRLLNECFILKNNNNTKQSYYFILRERETVSSYLEMLGYELCINEELGVISLNNPYGTGRIHLRLFDSIILLILRLIYIEEKKKLSLSNDVEIIVDEIYERYRSLRNEIPKKTDMRETLRLFRRYNIISNLDSDIGNTSTRIIIYPSVVLSLDNVELNRVYENSKNKLETYIKGDENNDSTDEENTD